MKLGLAGAFLGFGIGIIGANVLILKGAWMGVGFFALIFIFSCIALEEELLKLGEK